MHARKLEELLVYQKSLEGADAVSAFLDRRTWWKNRKLQGQLAESSGAVPAHIAEGYGQLTDRHFAHYLGIARGSSLEIRGHLAVARRQKHITPTEELEVSGLYQDLVSMLDAFIEYLLRSNRRDRLL